MFGRKDKPKKSGGNEKVEDVIAEVMPEVVALPPEADAEPEAAPKKKAKPVAVAAPIVLPKLDGMSVSRLHVSGVDWQGTILEIVRCEPGSDLWWVRKGDRMISSKGHAFAMVPFQQLSPKLQAAVAMSLDDAIELARAQ